MNENEIKLAYRSHDEGMIEGKLEVIDEIYGEDFENYSSGLPEFLRHGRSAIYQHYTFLRSAFSDIEIETHQQIVEDDLIGLHWTWKARHTGDFLGIPATGVQVQIEGFEVIQVRDGMIRAAWIIQDNVSMMAQLQAAALKQA
ncbi:MAG: ester cyclase [Chloroflexi bacterium]|nr:ester cyclase [Chloroflexota bacterium]